MKLLKFISDPNRRLSLILVALSFLFFAICMIFPSMTIPMYVLLLICAFIYQMYEYFKYYKERSMRKKSPEEFESEWESHINNKGHF